MQPKIIALAIALSFNSVQAGLLKRASVSGGYFVLPTVNFNADQEAAPLYRGCEILRNDIQKTSAMVGELTRKTDTTATDKANQAIAISGQVTTNGNSISNRVGTIVAALVISAPGAASSAAGAAPSPTTPTAPSTPSADVGAIAEEIVRAVQGLVQNITVQLNTLTDEKNKVTSLADFTGRTALQMASTNANIAIAGALSTIIMAARTLLGAVASILANVNGAATSTLGDVNGTVTRVRGAQAQLNPTVNVGAAPSVGF